MSPGRARPRHLQHVASQLTQGVGTQVANSGSRRVDSRSEEAIGVEAMRILLTHCHSHPSATQHTNYRKLANLHLDVCPGGKGYEFGKEPMRFCHQDLQNDREGSFWLAREALWRWGVPKSSTPSHRALF